VRKLEGRILLESSAGRWVDYVAVVIFSIKLYVNNLSSFLKQYETFDIRYCLFPKVKVTYNILAEKT
jgi:hypothetical protein